MLLDGGGEIYDIVSNNVITVKFLCGIRLWWMASAIITLN